ncbi:GNAT family N-acetyltransferase [Actinopolymorpha alba]|uniref:GNAT family N-acetyltransferase n=1 Tax=Actinopolymorpha alba TaxID=533267 RepID=UPI0003603270|nr:GNAT family N-acetyltransferase [Actinopolymorpha alba]
MRTEASEWLAEIGIDQWRQPWPTHEAMAERCAASIRAGETWMVRDDEGATAATVTLDTYADPQLWTTRERAEPAMYVHRLIVRRGWAGLGTRILNWASAKAARQGNDWIRIDVRTDNTPLHDYYQRNGFQHVRTLHSDYPSGALFQRPTKLAAPKRSAPLAEPTQSLPD